MIKDQNDLIRMTLDFFENDGVLDKFEALQLVSYIKKVAKFDTGNDPIMEAAEAYAHNYYGGELLGLNKKSIDIETDNGMRVQVKGRTLGNPYHNGTRRIKTTVKASHNDFDIIALIVFNNDGQFDSHWEITKEYFDSVKNFDEHDNIWTMPNTQTQWENYERKSK